MADLESRLREAFARGDWLDLGPGEEDVPGPLLASLLLTEYDGSAGHVPALRLRGAHVTGVLDVAYGPVAAQVHFDNCTFDTPPDVSGATVRTLRLTRSTLPGLQARLVQVAGDLDLSDTVVTGMISVEDGDIEGSLLLRRAKILVPGSRAVAAGGIQVGGGIFGRECHVEGELRLIGAKVDGGVFLDDADLDHAMTFPVGEPVDPKKLSALTLDSAQLTWLRLDGVTIHGEVRLRTARVEGEVSFEGAHLHGEHRHEPDGEGHGRLVAVRARGLQAGDLRLTPASVEGVVDLSQARLGALRARADRWPAEVRLDGLTYEHVLTVLDDEGSAPTDVRRGREWLVRDVDGYRPQPYEELAGYYRRLGHDDDARRILLAKQRRRRATLPWWQRIGGYTVDGLVGYGYRPWLAALWSLLLIGVGWAVFAANPPRALVPDESPTFSSLVYTLDLLVPIGAFGQRAAFDPIGWTHWVADFLIASGWVLATALIAGVTRNVGRD